MNLVLKSLLTVGVVAGTLSFAAPVANASNNSCIDGSSRWNMSVKWNSRDTAVVTTKDSRPLCADVELYISSYTMPDYYNGKGFADPSATPQFVFASKTFVMKKGATTSGPVTIAVPNECTNIQSDIYFPPEVKKVGPSGHPYDQIINGTIFAKTKDDCTPPVVEEPPVEEPVVEEPPVVEEAPVVVEEEPEVLAETVKELPKTGNALNATVIGLLASLGTYAAAYRLRK